MRAIDSSNCLTEAIRCSLAALLSLAEALLRGLGLLGVIVFFVMC